MWSQLRSPCDLSWGFHVISADVSMWFQLRYPYDLNWGFHMMPAKVFPCDLSWGLHVISAEITMWSQLMSPYDLSWGFHKISAEVSMWSQLMSPCDLSWCYDDLVRKGLTFITLDSNGDKSVVNLRVNTSRLQPCERHVEKHAWTVTSDSPHTRTRVQTLTHSKTGLPGKGIVTCGG